MISKKRLLPILVAVLMVFAMILVLSTQEGATYAAQGDPAVVLGSESVLKDTANTDDAQTVRFAEYDWRVISCGDTGNGAAKQDGVLTLFLSDSVLTVSFNDSSDAENANWYKGSNLQSSVDNFYDDAFSESEKASVVKRALAVQDYTSDWPGSNGVAGEATEGNLWPLSTAEANLLPNSLRSASYYCWLRSPGLAVFPEDYGRLIANVYPGGNLNDTGTYVDNGYQGMRPAFWLDSDSILLTFEAENGKSADVGALTSVGTNSGDTWKLTIRDDAHNEFQIDNIEANGSTLTIDYSKAVPGTDEYVSAIVADASGNVVYYGKLGQVSSASGYVTVDVSGKWSLNNGNKLYIFNEQCRNSHKTDYASELIEVTASMFDDGSWTGKGTAAEPYVISSEKGWSTLAEFVSSGNSTSDQYFELGANIRTTKMIGTAENPFRGHLDGTKHMLVFTSENHPEGAAPFAYVDGADISNLHVAGSITGNNQRASGLIGENHGSSKVTNCRVSVTISGRKLVGGFCIGAGSDSGDALNINSCVFDGKITGNDESGGFVAWATSGLHITNCIVAPQDGSAVTGGTFYYINGDDTARLTNSLYTQALGTTQGKQARSITGDAGITINFGSGTSYDVSGITAYGTGLGYGGAFYAGIGDNVSLTMADPSVNDKKYIVNAGTLTGSGTKYKLAMPDEDVVISTTYTKLPKPQNIKISDCAKPSGYLDGSPYLSWDDVDGAQGYYVTPYILKNGKAVALCDPIDNEKYTGYYMSPDITDKYSNGNGTYTFTVQAYGAGGLKSDLEMIALISSNAGECIKDFMDNNSSYFSKDTEGNYYIKSDNGDFQLIAVTPKSVYEYNSIAEAKADAYYVPGEATLDRKLSESTKQLYAIGTDSTCSVTGDFHKWIRTVQKATTTDWGFEESKCSDCGASGYAGDISPATGFKTSKSSYTYTGKAIKPKVTVTTPYSKYGEVLKEGTDYTVSYKNNINVGTATATVTLIGDREGTASVKFTIAKAANPLRVKARTAKVKYSKVKKKAQTLKVSKVIKFTKKGKGKMTYKLFSAKKGKKNFKKYFKISKRYGTVTVKKGLKKGTYKIKVKVKAGGNTNYKQSAVKTVTFKIRVK